MNKPKIDPELLRQLGATDGPVEAVVQLRGKQSNQEFATPEETESRAMDLIRRVEHSTGLRSSDFHVFKNLSSFVIRAPADLVVRLSEQDEVRSVVANRQPSSGLIPPRNVKPARPPAAHRRRRKD